MKYPLFASSLIFVCFASFGQITVSGEVSGTWTKANSPYIMSGEVSVPLGQTLIIEPGVIVQSPLYYHHFYVYGTLLAKGTPADSIYFRGVNNRPPSTPATPGGSIRFMPGSSASEMEYASIDRVWALVATGSVAIYVSSECSIKNSTVKYTQPTGVYVEGNNLSPSIQNSRFINPFFTPGFIPLHISVSPSSCSKIWGNLDTKVTIRGGSLTSNSTWPAPGPNSYYEFDSTFTIPLGKTLTIEPGATVELSLPDRRHLEVFGSLLAKGTATDSVRFRGTLKPTGTNPFFYNGGTIFFYPGSSGSMLEYVSTYRLGARVYSGIHAIYVGSECTIRNSTVRNSERVGIYVEEGILSPLIQNNRFANNIIDLSVAPSGFERVSGNSNTKINIREGIVETNSTWKVPGLNSHYELDGPVRVPVGKTLTIEPGVTIKSVEIGNHRLVVDGTLLARGTASDSIRFLGKPDPEGTPRYSGIYINEGSIASVLDYVLIDHMGGDYGVSREFYGSSVLVGSECTIKNSTVQNSKAVGINVYSPNVSLSNILISNSYDAGLLYSVSGNSPVISNSRFLDNKYVGVQVFSGHPTFVNCSFYGNTFFGINNESTSAADVVDARNCYWDTPTGPYHPTLNPTGNGNEVSDKVLFNPWSQTPGNCTPISIKPGNWNDPTIWLCGQIPNSSDPVVIRHVVTVPGSYTAQASQVTYETGGSLSLGNRGKLQLSN